MAQSVPNLKPGLCQCDDVQVVNRASPLLQTDLVLYRAKLTCAEAGAGSLDTGGTRCRLALLTMACRRGVTPSGAVLLPTTVTIGRCLEAPPRQPRTLQLLFPGHVVFSSRNEGITRHTSPANCTTDRQVRRDAILSCCWSNTMEYFDQFIRDSWINFIAFHRVNSNFL